jgi:regulator of protease activity HflC (stomatin/prohibitin superfamily)
MTFPYPENPANWQTAYTRDDAYREFGKFASYYNNTSLLGSGIIALIVTIRFSPIIGKLFSTYLGNTIVLTAASILLTFLLAVILASILLHFIQSTALGFASEFFINFYHPQEGIDPAEIIKYRLNGKFKLPPPFNMIFQFKYIMAREGGIVKADEWPAWMARVLGGPLLLIVFDGCALYLERGNLFSRVVGPGDKTPFLEWHETVKYVVDLRPKIREDKFDVWTKDGIKIELKARIECRIGDPKKKDPDGQLVYPYDPVAVQKAIERYALRWPTCPEGEPSEFTWFDAAWGQVTGIVPDYISSRMLDDLFVASRNGGQILSPTALQEIFDKLNKSTNGFGVFITDFQILEVKIPKEVEESQKEFWKAEKQGRATIIDGETKAYRIKTREEVRAEAQRNIILAIAQGLEKNRDGQFTEPVLLSLSGVLDESLREPLTRAYLAKETLDTLEQLQKILDNPAIR